MLMLDRLSRLIGRPATIAEGPVTMMYMRDHLRWESIKGFIGVAFCFGVIFYFKPVPWFTYTLGAFGLFFLIYFLQQLQSYLLVYRVDEAGITEMMGGRKKMVRWGELERFRLHFFSPKRSRFDQGVLNLTLKSGRHRIKVDSTLDHFPTLLARAAGAAREKGVYLDPTTLSNLEQLGL